MNPPLLAIAPSTPLGRAGRAGRPRDHDRPGRHPRPALSDPASTSASGPQTSVAEWELTVELEAEQRGTHMSRFVETLERLERASR